MEINPNGRIPALTDTLPDGTPINLFESGSIMQYLVDRYDTEHKVSYPRGSKEGYEVNNWLHWQMGGLGELYDSEKKEMDELMLMVFDDRAYARSGKPLLPVCPREDPVRD